MVFLLGTFYFPFNLIMMKFVRQVDGVAKNTLSRRFYPYSTLSSNSEFPEDLCKCDFLGTPLCEQILVLGHCPSSRLCLKCRPIYVSRDTCVTSKMGYMKPTQHNSSARAKKAFK
jgi:hypothetical protein